GNRYREGDKPDALPDGVVRALDDGLMVGGEKDLVRRLELPEVLTHAPCTNRVPSSSLFDKYLSESAALLGFDGCDKSLPKQVCAFGGVTVVVTHQKQLGGGFHRVGAKEHAQCVEEGTLAVAASAPQDE